MGAENNTNNHAKDKENVQLRASLGRIAAEGLEKSIGGAGPHLP
jgi:hypothetical protein